MVRFQLSISIMPVFFDAIPLLIVRYKKGNRRDEILIFRNKRTPIRKVKVMSKNEDGCLACSLYDSCLLYHDGKCTICEAMKKAGVIENDIQEDIFFVDIWI